MNKQLLLAIHDFQYAFKHWRIWTLLGWQDIKLRYRRSYLGPFWITISMMVLIYSMGFLYGKLFHMELKHYFPHIAIGMIVWGLINMLVSETSEIFSQSANIIRQIKLAYTVHIMRVLVRNIIVFLHNVLALVPLIVFLPIPITPAFFWWIPGIIILSLNGMIYGLILAMLGARYQDIKPIITNLMQVCFFLTPIMWMPSSLPSSYGKLIQFNPFFHFINILREPITNGQCPTNSFIACILMFFIGLFGVFLLFPKHRHRIVYWV
jgi:lipopolysaccharide transport system permease protein